MLPIYLVGSRVASEIIDVWVAKGEGISLNRELFQETNPEKMCKEFLAKFSSAIGVGSMFGLPLPPLSCVILHPLVVASSAWNYEERDP